jgi:FkbM family methyltransferase
MRIGWTIKRTIGRGLYAGLERLPEAWRRKTAILLSVLKHDWRLVRFLSPFSADMGCPGEEELARHFQGLDAGSLALIQRYAGKAQFTPWLDWVAAKSPRHSHLWAGLCTAEEFRTGLQQEEEELPALRREYHLSGTLGEASSLIHHHGLRAMSPQLQGHLRGKAVIDAGAYAGESALVFLRYEPSQVHAFEPSPSNRELFRQVMASNQVPPERVVLVDKGLSARAGTVTFSENTTGTSLRAGGSCTVELVTLDQYVREQGLGAVGLIKADVEGMGLELLKGALETIRRDRPVLSLCIYHNREEFLGTYELLRSQNLPYDFKVASFCLPWENSELVLLGLPRL